MASAHAVDPVVESVKMSADGGSLVVNVGGTKRAHTILILSRVESTYSTLEMETPTSIKTHKF